MATFPALKPSSRTFTPGERPHSVINTLDGNNIRVRQSNVVIEQRLQLTFTALTEADMLSIRSHYIGQQGSYIAFPISNEVLSGVVYPSGLTLSGYSWRYASTPEIEDVGIQRYTVSVTLAAVPAQGLLLDGAALTAATSLNVGIIGGDAVMLLGLVSEIADATLDYGLITQTVTQTQDRGSIA